MLETELTKEAQENLVHISVESKTRLAKMLAMENITVEHRSVPTACFYPTDRILVLPLWAGLTEELYDLLQVHETAHALWTPADGWHGATQARGRRFAGFLNVTEDARIEKKAKRKYPGSKIVFRKGYQTMLDRDFFKIADRDLATLGLIDRINLHFKVGTLLDVPFAEDEARFVDMTAAAESFEDAEAAAVAIFEHMKADAEAETSNPPPPPEENGDEGEPCEEGEEGATQGDAPEPTSDTETDGDDSEAEGAGDEGEGEDTTPGEGDDGEEGDVDDGVSDDSPTPKDEGAPEDIDAADDDEAAEAETPADEGGDVGNGNSEEPTGPEDEDEDDGDPVSETDEAQREAEGAMVVTSGPEINYLSLPVPSAYKLDDLIFPCERVATSMIDFNNAIHENCEKIAIKDVKKYMSGAGKAVGHLVREFEMRKAADAAKRTTFAQTGVLNTNKVHSHAWNEDIFLKSNTTPDGKNHGLVIYVDWSGSMSNTMQGTLEQVINLVLFCKKVQIPYVVYGFSNAWRGPSARYIRPEKPTDETNGTAMSQWRDDCNHHQARCELMFGYSPHEPTHEEAETETWNQGKLKPGNLIFNPGFQNFRLIELASSAVSAKVQRACLISLIMMRNAYRGRERNAKGNQIGRKFYTPSWLGLGGTPLNEALMTAIPVVKAFTAQHNLQIVNTVFLTDGEGSEMKVKVGFDRDAPATFGRYDRRHEAWTTKTTDMVSGRTIITNGTHSYNMSTADRGFDDEGNRLPADASVATAFTQTGALVRALKDATQSNVVNFFITDSYGIGREYEMEARRKGEPRSTRSYNELPEEVAAELEKEGAITVHDSTEGWSQLYLIVKEGMVAPNSTAWTDDESDEESPDAEADDILNAAFLAASARKLIGRKMLKEFSKMIAV